MTDETHYTITLEEFANHIVLRFHFRHSTKIHDERGLRKSQMSFMYAPGVESNPPFITGAFLDILTLHRLLQKP
jgi:hypothetical protein